MSTFLRPASNCDLFRTANTNDCVSRFQIRYGLLEVGYVGFYPKVGKWFINFNPDVLISQIYIEKIWTLVHLEMLKYEGKLDELCEAIKMLPNSY